MSGEKPKYSFDKLRGRIKETFGSEKIFAEKLGISYSSLSGKLNGNIYFSVDEIDMSIDLLSINHDETYSYFFTKKVE